MSEFFKSFRKHGFILTLETLEQFKKFEAKEPDFFQALKDNESYLNEYYRVKKELIQHGLIAYRLDSEYNKVLFLTEKGKTVLNKIREIDKMLKNEQEGDSEQALAEDQEDLDEDNTEEISEEEPVKKSAKKSAKKSSRKSTKKSTAKKSKGNRGKKSSKKK